MRLNLRDILAQIALKFVGVVECMNVKTTNGKTIEKGNFSTGKYY